jgi:hypothetical protein
MDTEKRESDASPLEYSQATGFATRADLLAPRAARFGSMTLPVRGATVRFRSLSDLEYSQFQLGGMRQDENGDWTDDPDKLGTSRARLIALCLVDAGGLALFSPADADALSAALDAADSAALYDKLREHCGLNRKAARDDAKKNLPAIPAGSSPTGSPSSLARRTSTHSVAG